MTISNDLRSELEKALERETLYRIAKGSGVNWAVLHRFLSGQRPTLRLETVDRVAGYLNLQLKKVKSSKATQRKTRKRSTR